MQLDSLKVVACRYKRFALGTFVIVMILLFVPSIHQVDAQGTAAHVGGNIYPYRVPGEGLSGTTVGGYFCKPGLRQVPWSVYAPLCVPKWTGNNGGSTAPGVAASTITVTVDIANNGGLCTFLDKEGSKSTASTAVFKRNMNTYVALFNKDFELWGRRVVIKYFNGQGCDISELLGQDQSQAEADAQTAASLGAFADYSEVASTPPYDTALASHHIVAIGGEFMPHSWYQQYAPYEYSYYPSCTKFVQAAVDVIGKSINGLPAIYAGNNTYQHEPAKIGLIYPSDPLFSPCAAEAAQLLSQAHIPLADQFSYSMTDLASLSPEAVTAVAGFKEKGVTTVICACDPLTPAFLAEAAASQHYFPEWLVMSISDVTEVRGIMSAIAGKAFNTEWAHALTMMVQPVTPQDQEFTVAYQLATGHRLSSPPAIGDAGTLYQGLLLLFSGLQQAGPDLTPATFQRGMWSLPPSVQDAGLGGWLFKPGHYTAPSNFQVLYWSNRARGPVTHEKGAWVACNGGKFYSIYGSTSVLPAGKQLACFGKDGSSAPWNPPSSAIPKI